MSKIEAGKFTIERQRVELAPLLDECTSMVSAVAETAGVNLACEVERGIYLQADRRAIKQAVVNLLSNAIKFTPSEGTVTLSARPGSSRYRIRVSAFPRPKSEGSESPSSKSPERSRSTTGPGLGCRW
jgi:signal transduction histidine kinase